jgi:hypothetical protein
VADHLKNLTTEATEVRSFLFVGSRDDRGGDRLGDAVGAALGKVAARIE